MILRELARSYGFKCRRNYLIKMKAIGRGKRNIEEIGFEMYKDEKDEVGENIGHIIIIRDNKIASLDSSNSLIESALYKKLTELGKKRIYVDYRLR